MLIQAKRDPKKEWLLLRYCVTGEEVQWTMKDCLEEWKVPTIPKKIPKAKEQAKVGPSQNSNNPATNTGKETKHGKETGGSTTTRKIGKNNTIPKTSF
jgi:hypothetical protein